jgi:flagellar motor switch/type III secretory pathway protein FliN
MALPAAEQTVTSLPAPADPWEFAKRLPCRLSVDLPVPGFTVRDLLSLEAHSIVATQAPEGTRVPIRVNGQVIARGEFDVVGMRLAVRILELL